LPTTGGIVGAGQIPRSIASDRIALQPAHVVVIATDGLLTRIDLERDMLRRPALVIAHHLLATYGRDNDDALVVVMR
jgi:hypothetical protein